MMANKDVAIQYTIFSKNIRYYRKRKGYTQEKLAEKAEMSISYIKQIESCNEFKNLTLTAMLKLSKALDVPINKLFYEQKN
ncbi:MAG: helix-turn-helix transcriptional regulator [Firmicutes bacterium]|nr:helix-turn-helix transcriptional regulator [Bacillota bacterium]